MRKPKAVQVPVSERAVLARINRKLAGDNEQIRQPRPGTRAQAELGDFYRLRFGRGGSEPSTNVIDTHVDLETLARELGVLSPWEVVR
jgi:hypothetical protein